MVTKGPRDSFYTRYLLYSLVLCSTLYWIYNRKHSVSERPDSSELTIEGFSSYIRKTTPEKAVNQPDRVGPTQEADNKKPQSDSPSAPDGYVDSLVIAKNKSSSLKIVLTKPAAEPKQEPTPDEQDKLYLSVEPVDPKSNDFSPIRIKLSKLANGSTYTAPIPSVLFSGEHHLALFVCSDAQEKNGHCNSKPPVTSSLSEKVGSTSGKVFYFDYLLLKDGKFYSLDPALREKNYPQLKQELIGSALPTDQQIRIFKRVLYYKLSLESGQIGAVGDSLVIPWAVSSH